MQFLELDKYKKRVFQLLLVFTIIAGLVFAFLNLQRDLETLAITELAVVLVAIWLLFLVNKTKGREKFNRLALSYLIIFLSIMMFAFSIEGVSITIFVWALGIPLVSYLLLGLKPGFIMTAVFYSLTAYLFFSGFHGNPVMVDSVAYANFIVCALVFWGISHSYEHSNRYAKDKLNQMAVFDHLTGLYNRSMISRLFDQAVEHSASDQQEISLVSFDLDRFKKINDQFGHAIGDEVLKRFSTMVLQQIPDDCSAFRLGGEEFLILLPKASKSVATSLAEKIRLATKNIIISGLPKDFFVSVSSGVITGSVHVAKLNSMLKIADRRLYQAKQQGRNIVINQD